MILYERGVESYRGVEKKIIGSNEAIGEYLKG